MSFKDFADFFSEIDKEQINFRASDVMTFPWEQDQTIVKQEALCQEEILARFEKVKAQRGLK